MGLLGLLALAALWLGPSPEAAAHGARRARRARLPAPDAPDPLYRRIARVFRDKGDGEIIVDRVVHHRRVKWLSARWKRFGVVQPFDIYLVAFADRGRHMDRAVDALIRKGGSKPGGTQTL